MDVDPRARRRLLQLHHALLRGLELLRGELLGLVVAVVALVVVEVPIQLALGLGRVALVVLVVLARVEAVALVEAAGRRAVLGPVAHAHPAELVLALGAGHVVAALVLLDARLALRAALRVGQDPVRRLALVLALLGPFGQRRAAGRLVGLLAAADAEGRAAAAVGHGAL